MRLAIVSLSAVLLSGCSWLGGMSKPDNRYQNNARASYANGAPSHHMGVRGPHNPCMVYSPVQPVPQGCDPASVTLATGYNSGAVQPGGNYATGGYGSHAGNAHNVGQQAKSGPRLRKPRLRGALTLGTEKSVSGELLNFNNVGGVALYNPALFEESRVERSGVTAAGYTDTTHYEPKIYSFCK